MLDDCERNYVRWGLADVSEGRQWRATHTVMDGARIGREVAEIKLSDVLSALSYLRSAFNGGSENGATGAGFVVVPPTM